MATIRRKCLSANNLEMIAQILGDTNNGLTGTEIHRLLLQSNIEDVDANNTKWKRLFSAFAEKQNKLQCSNQILKFIALALSPTRYINQQDRYQQLLLETNQQLAFVGYELKKDGQYKEIAVAKTLSDIQIKVDNLKQELDNRKVHQEIFKYCKAELLQNNYFHSVLEANKGLFQRIRELSGIAADGIPLIEQVFSSTPILIINNYQTASERNEHTGFCNLLKGLCAMFRNPTAHEPKVEWEIGEQDALEILSIISYCHRRLDKAQRIR